MVTPLCEPSHDENPAGMVPPKAEAPALRIATSPLFRSVAAGYRTSVPAMVNDGDVPTAGTPPPNHTTPPAFVRTLSQSLPVARSHAMHSVPSPVFPAPMIVSAPLCHAPPVLAWTAHEFVPSLPRKPERSPAALASPE